MDAEPIAIAAAGREPEAVVEQSAGSSVIFLPAIIRGGRFHHPFGGEIPDLLDALPVVIISTAVQDLDLDAVADAGADDEGDLGEAATSTATRSAPNDGV